MEEAVKIYGNEAAVKKAILNFPQFGSYNHSRVLKQKNKIGRLIDLSEKETIDYILKYPVNAGCSYKRDLARIDVVRQLQKEGLEINEEVKDWFLRCYMTSPYSKGTRLRYSKAQGLPEPKLLKEARKKFLKK